MAVMDFLKVGIVADDKTTKGIRSAKKNISSLDRSVTNLAKTFAGVFAAHKIISFGKASAKAFMEDEKSATLLANAVKNLGLAFAAPEIESYIASLSRAAGVADDELRPAMQRLLQTTGSITKSEELLAQAIDISRGAGVGLSQVVSDLSAAYVGNTKGLKKYYLGLSQTELKTMSFTQIQEKLNEQFNGASQAYLQTYAGKIDKLNTAFGEAKETIGKGLLDGLSNLGSDGVDGIDLMSEAMARFSDNVNTAIIGVTSLLGKLGGTGSGKSSDILNKATSLSIFGILGTGLLEGWMKEGTKVKSSGIAPSTSNTHLAELTAKATAAAKIKAEKDAAKRAKELAAAQAKQTKALKEQALLKKQSAIFDMQQIQLVAALKGKLSEDERNRVLLQLALLQGNEAEASRLSKIVANTIDETGNLAKLLTTLPDANNPFKGWDEWLRNFSNEMKATIALADATKPGVITDASSFAGVIPSAVTDSAATRRGGNITDASGFAGIAPIVVQIDGKTIATALQDQSLSGNNTRVNRTSGNFSAI